MWRRLLLTATSVAAILALGAGVPPSGSLGRITSEISPVELLAIAYENGCVEAPVADAAVTPARRVADAYPTFLGVAVDPDNGRVVMSDSGLKGLLMYDRASGTPPGVDQVTRPLADVRGSPKKLPPKPKKSRARGSRRSRG